MSFNTRIRRRELLKAFQFRANAARQRSPRPHLTGNDVCPEAGLRRIVRHLGCQAEAMRPAVLGAPVVLVRLVSAEEVGLLAFRGEVLKRGRQE